METTRTRIPDPVKAREFFENKMTFTTGPVELDRMIKSHDNGIVVVDVRESEDFAKGHIPGAINLPKGTWTSPAGLSKDKTNVVYCYSIVCHLAAAACVEFAQLGYPVMELDGGFESWKKHDLDIDHEPTNRLRRVADRVLPRRH